MAERYGCWQIVAVLLPGDGYPYGTFKWPTPFPRTHWRAGERPVGLVGLGPSGGPGTRTRNTPPAHRFQERLGYGHEGKCRSHLTRLEVGAEDVGQPEIASTEPSVPSNDVRPLL